MQSEILEAVERYKRKEAGAARLGREVGLSEFRFVGVLRSLDVPLWPRGVVASNVLSQRKAARNEKIVAAVRSGRTYQDVADEYGIAHHGVHAICKKKGLLPRPGVWTGAKGENMSYWYRKQKRLRERENANATNAGQISGDLRNPAGSSEERKGLPAAR